VVKLADGTWLVGDYSEGALVKQFHARSSSPSSPSPMCDGCPLDIARVVTRGQAYVEKPDSEQG
jgi:hypothetical protein